MPFCFALKWIARTSGVEVKFVKTYFDGKSPPRSYTEAAKRFHKAADEGIAIGKS